MPQALECHALVIGINAYSSGIAPLQSAVGDAQAVAALLQSEHAYAVTCLTDAAASGSAIRACLEDAAGRLSAESAFLLYFGGHGVALGDGSAGPQGYLLPHDARAAEVASWLSMETLRQALEALPCRHMLVVLDCCFAGAFRWASARDATFAGPLYDSQLARYLGGDAWQALTSAAHDQRAADIAPGARNTRDHAGGAQHSPFAAAFLRGLSGAADSARGGHAQDGVITATELHQFLFEELMPATAESRQTPGIWPLRPDNAGEFIFLNPRAALNTLPDPPLDDRNNPWLGLRTYSASEVGLFFGRRRVVDALLKRVLDPSGPALLVVVGASGTGKSSVVKAGLLPQLAAATAARSAGTRGWTLIEVARLGANPQVQLDAALRDLPPDAAGARPLLLFDQFEELYTQCTDASVRSAFLQRVRALLDQADGPLIVLTLRSDFEPRLAGSEYMAELLPRARFLVPAFSSAELREIIEGPAAAKALYFEPAALVGQLLDEIEATPGALPLLSFALAEMYRHAQVRRRQSGAVDRSLTLADYQATGGVIGGLHRRASSLLEQADSKAQQTIRRVFLRMVAQDGARLARRRVHRSELEYPTPHEQQRVQQVIDSYVEARLLVADGDTIEPAHDSLVVAWEKLQDWLVAGGSQELQRALWRDACDWKAHAMDAGLLWDGDPRLPQAEAGIGECNSLEQAFVRAGSRRRKWRRGLLAGIVLAVISALSFATWYALDRAADAVRQTGIAEQQTKVAEQQTAIAQEQLAQARYANGKATLEQARVRLQNLDYFTAAQLAAIVIGFRGYGADDAAAAQHDSPGLIAPDKPEYDELINVLSEASLFSVRPVAWRALGRARFSADGNALAGLGQPGKLEIRRFKQQQLIELALPAELEAIDIALNPDGSLVAALTDAAIYWWQIDATGQASAAAILAVPADQRLTSVVFDPQHKRLAAAGNAVVLLWDLASPATPPLSYAGSQDFSQRSLIFLPDGAGLVSGGWHNSIQQLDIAKRRGAPTVIAPGRSLGPDWSWDRWTENVQKGDHVTALAITADGQHLAAVSANQLLVGELKGQQIRYERDHYFEARLQIDSMALAPDGRRVAIASADEVVILSFPELTPLATLEPLSFSARPDEGAHFANYGSQPGGGSIQRMSFGADGTLLALASDTAVEFRDVSSLENDPYTVAEADFPDLSTPASNLAELRQLLDSGRFDVAAKVKALASVTIDSAAMRVDDDPQGDGLSISFGETSGSVLLTLQPPQGKLLALGLSRFDSNLLDGPGGLIDVYETASGRKLMRIPLPDTAWGLDRFRYSADGTQLLWWSSNFDGYFDSAYALPAAMPDLTVYATKAACLAPVNLPLGSPWVGSKLLDCP